MYSIGSIDRQKRRIVIAIDGFLAPAEIPALGADFRAAVRSLGLSGTAPHDLLLDLTTSKVASREAIAEIGTILRNPKYKHLWARNIAFVTPSALLRMQMERVVAGKPGLRVFDDLPTATAWLDAGIASTEPVILTTD